MNEILAALIFAALQVTAPALDEMQPCDAAIAQSELGKAATPARIEAVRRGSHAASVRIIRPGDAISMDYQTHRLNIEVDGSNRIVGIYCG